MKYVTAKELAEELLKNPDDIVCSVTDNFEQGHCVIPKTSTGLHRYKGKLEQKAFRDAFDGGDYESTIVNYSGEPDSESSTFVQL